MWKSVAHPTAMERSGGTDRRLLPACARPGQLAAAALDMLAEHVKPGVTTEELDERVLRVRAR